MRSIPSKAPPAINRIFSVFNSINFWSGCFLPPLGETFTIVPSNSFRRACCTPSPETSRVIDGLSLLRAILSISSIKQFLFLLFLYYNLLLARVWSEYFQRLHLHNLLRSKL